MHKGSIYHIQFCAYPPNLIPAKIGLILEFDANIYTNTFMEVGVRGGWWFIKHRVSNYNAG